MKPPIILVAATMFSAAFAADITLTDGRTFQDATISSQSPRTIIIKHAAGLTSVDKRQLPADLRAQYPIDEAAAQAAEQKASVAREAALIARKAEAERAAKIRTEREAAVAADAITAKESAQTHAVQTATIQSQARAALQRYFAETYSWNPGAERIVEVSITDFRQADGWTDRWTVTGSAIIRNYQHSSAPVKNTGSSASNASQEAYRAAKKTVETREFEATYAPDSSSPLNVTLR